MTIKQKIWIVEALIAILLSSINVVQIPEKLMAENVPEATVSENVEEEYVSSVADYIYHFDDVFTTVEAKGWVIIKAEAKAHPYPFSSVVTTIPKYNTVTVTGYNDYGLTRIEFNGQVYYVENECVTTDIKVFDAACDSTYNQAWKGRALTPSRGTIIGPSGKETYYNLYMGGVIAIMRRMGNNDVYWIRADGVKMLGDYVMIAAALSIRPRGSLVPTSLGMGIVCDTGGFALRNLTQIDIAVDW